MPPGNREGAGVSMNRKPGDLPVMAVIYLRERGSAGRMGFFKIPGLLGQVFYITEIVKSEEDV